MTYLVHAANNSINTFQTIESALKGCGMDYSAKDEESTRETLAAGKIATLIHGFTSATIEEKKAPAAKQAPVMSFERLNANHGLSKNSHFLQKAE